MARILVGSAGGAPSNNFIRSLPPGLVWIRGMGVEPVLTTAEELEALESQDGLATRSRGW